MTVGPACSVPFNPWVRCTLLIALRLFVPGMAWGWLVWRSAHGRRRLPQYVVAAGIASVVGAAVGLLPAVFLAEAGLYSVWCDVLVVVLCIGSGFAAGLAFRRRAFLEYARTCCPGLGAFALAAAVVMLLPHRGEWVPGGWDPGVYVSQGVHVAATGTFHPRPDPAYSALNADELPLFTRDFGVYVETFPGVPIDPESRAHRHYFFRLMPGLVSMLTRCGGLRAATRANMVVGALVLFAFAGLLLSHGCRVSHLLFSLLILGSQPIWLYHLHVPTSEMLQLLLVCGAGLMLPLRKTRPAASALLALIVFAAILNRLSFAPFAGLLLALLAASDFRREDRGRVWGEHALLAAAIACGVGYDALFCRITVTCLGNVIRALLWVSGAGMAAWVILDAAAASGRVRARLPACFGRLLCAACLLGLAAACVACVTFSGRPEVRMALTNMRRLVPFVGWTVCAAAAAGGLLLVCGRRGAGRELKTFVIFLAGVTAAVFVHKHIVDIYPYATRRYLAFTVPAAAICGGYLLSRLWEAGEWAGRACAAAALLVLLGGSARRGWRAWTGTEYDGVSAVLARAAARIGSDELIVADHPWWGTPMTFIYGKPVLNGRPFYSRPGTETMASGLAALRRIRGTGRRIRFLTSTAKGLDIFPLAVPGAALEWSSPELALEEIAHSPRASDFATRQRRFVFRLYSWPASRE